MFDLMFQIQSCNCLYIWLTYLLKLTDKVLSNIIKKCHGLLYVDVSDCIVLVVIVVK